MARGDLPIFASDNKMVAMLQSGWAKVLNPIIKQSRQRAAVAASHTAGDGVTVSADGTNPVLIKFNAIQGDVDGSMTGQGAFVVKHAGLYLVGANVNVNNSSGFTQWSDFLHIQIQHNKNFLAYQREFANGATSQLGRHIAQPISCQAGDVIGIGCCVTKSGCTFDSSTCMYILRMG
jgi:hypothetical protein